jgi:hypothetical protein
MKKLLIYLVPILIPCLTVVLVNETSVPFQASKKFSIRGVDTANSAAKLPTECTWACHNDTDYCKKHHVKFLKSYFQVVDPIYYGIINGLKSFGDYQLANILFLVLAWPLLMYFLLVKSLLLQLKIQKLKKNG